MRRSVKPLVLLGLLGTLIFGSSFATQYGRALWGNRDIWWTPRSMALPLDQTRDVFELYVSGTSLGDHLVRRSLSAVEGSGRSYAVVAEDIRVRLNNWQTVRGSLLHSAVPAAFLLGASVTCLGLGVAGWLVGRREAG